MAIRGVGRRPPTTVARTPPLHQKHRFPEDLARRYAVQRVLGEGGFGRVVLARDQELDRSVAIKLLSASLESKDFRARFEREARVTARLQHPHIVTVYEHGFAADGTPFIVYEHVVGKDLESLVPTRPAPARVERWARELASALEAAHEAGIVHRDMKPANVLIRDTDDAAVLCDFGLARLEEGKTVQTAAGMLLGTPRFVAPENWVGHPPSPASDQFAWAATLHAALGGGSVYGSSEIGVIMERLRSYAPPTVPDPGGVSPTLVRVLHRALMPSPRARHASMREVLRALEGHEPAPDARTVSLAAVPVATRPDRATPLATALLEASPNPATRLLRAGAVLAVGVLVALAGAWLTPAPPPGSETSSPGVASPDAARSEAVEEAWSQVEQARDGLIGLFGVERGQGDRWDYFFLARLDVKEMARGLADVRVTPKFRRFLEVLLAWEALVRAGDGFRRPPPPPGAALPIHPQAQRMRKAMDFGCTLLAYFAHVGDRSLQQISDPGAVQRLHDTDLRRREIQVLTAEILAGTPADLGPDALPLVALRLRLARHLLTPEVATWLVSLPRALEDNPYPVQASAAVNGACSTLDALSARDPETCVAKEELVGRLADLVEQVEASGHGLIAGAIVARARKIPLMILATCGENAVAREVYERLHVASLRLLPILRSYPLLGMKLELSEELEWMRQAEGAVGSLPAEWELRRGRLAADLARPSSSP